MCQLVAAGPLSEHVSVHVEDGHRISLQAAGLTCYLADAEPINHRDVKKADVKGRPHLLPTVRNFFYRFCPVTQQILPRDPPAADNVTVQGICTLHVGAPSHKLFAR